MSTNGECMVISTLNKFNLYRKEKKIMSSDFSSTLTLATGYNASKNRCVEFGKSGMFYSLNSRIA